MAEGTFRINKVLKDFNIGLSTLTDFLKKKGINDELTQVQVVYSLLQTDYLFLERNGRIYKIRASEVIIPSGDGDNIETENGSELLTESGDELLADI